MQLWRLFINRNAPSNRLKLYPLLILLVIYIELSYCDHVGKLFDHHRRNGRTFPFFYPKEDEVVLSSPEECARSCVEGEEPKNCYYKFHVEFYTVNGPACDSPEFEKECILADGVERLLIPINRQLPGPAIEVCKNDRIIVDVENNAMGIEITLHWHGIFQNGFQYYDGVPYVTQCPIASSTTFRYDYVAQNSGTHFYHSHIATHLLDGQRGALIVKDTPSDNPFYQLYDFDEHVILLSDWMHELSLERFPGRYRNDVGQTPENILINGRGNWTDPTTQETTNVPLSTFTVKKGSRHRIRVINGFGTVCLAEMRVDKHNMLIIAQDGENVKPKAVDKIITSSGERVDFILTANQSLDSYWIQVRGIGECAENSVQQLAILRYEDGPEVPSTPAPAYNDSPDGITYNSLDGTTCNGNNTEKIVCVNQLESLEEDTDIMKVEPDERHILDFWFFNYTQYGGNPLFQADTYRNYFVAADLSQLLSMLNDIAFESPSSPLLTQPSSYQTMCKKNELSSCTQPCTCTQVIHTKLGNVVELVLYDREPQPLLHHPFHLHGYEFKVFSIGQFSPTTIVSRTNIEKVIEEHTQRLERGEYHNPPGKDTVKIPAGGYTIIRFKADNPGWWLMHCHFTWHHITGMELVIHVGDDDDLPPIPSHFPQCDNWTPALHTLNNFYGFRYPTP